MAMVILATMALAWRYAYPAMVSHIYAANAPLSWNKALLSMTLGEVHQTLGNPDEDVSAKEYQVWIRKQWWGWQELKVLIPNCFAASSRPSEVYYIVHVYGFYDPVIKRRIE